jgi:tryptophan 2,3-dioxygenase
MARKPTTYWEYIAVEQLLGLQRGLAADERELSNDEVLFITVHQIDELWFKLLLRELEQIRDLFAADTVPEQALSQASRGLRRVATLWSNVAAHFELMETLTTRDYLGFRDKLSPASGFQSAQLREIEILMGLPADGRVPLGHESSYLDALRDPSGGPSPALERVQRRAATSPSLHEAVRAWLFRTPIRGSRPGDAGDAAAVEGFVGDYLAAMGTHMEELAARAVDEAANADDRERLRGRYERELRAAAAFLAAEDVDAAEQATTRRVRAAIVFIESYRELPLLAWPRELLDGLIAMEQASLIFRQRHARMVERVIGRRTGTGGSAGVDYLDATALRYRVFRDVWAVRTLLLEQRRLPPLAQPEFYGFGADALAGGPARAHEGGA